jgi:hypothetical protein
MKKSELIEVVKKAIREEIKTSLRKVVKEEINKAIKGPIRRQNKKESTSIVEAKQQVRRGLDLQKQMLTKDSVLNDMLSQTANSMTPGELSNFGEDSSDAPSVLDADVPDAVQKAMNRDYTGLMKAIDKYKAGAGGFRP